MTSFKDSPNVSGNLNTKAQLIKPRMAGGNQLLIPIDDEMVVTNGDSVLPIIPITLVQP